MGGIFADPDGIAELRGGFAMLTARADSPRDLGFTFALGSGISMRRSKGQELGPTGPNFRINLEKLSQRLLICREKLFFDRHWVPLRGFDAGPDAE